MVLHPHLTKPQQRQKKILNLICVSIFCLILVLLFCVFTPFGDGLASQGQYLMKQSQSGVKHLPPLPEILPCPANESNVLPCYDPKIAVRFSRKFNEFRERHCPAKGERQRCLVPPPWGYKRSILWPESLGKIRFNNVPFTVIADNPKSASWMHRDGDEWHFQGGGSMFPEGVDKYIEHLKDIFDFDGSIRTALDVGGGVASFGGALLKKEVLTMTISPKDSYRAQVQFALERGLPSMIGLFATMRLPFPSRAFDLVHCGRCTVEFEERNGTYLYEVDRLLRPNGIFILAGQPVNWEGKEAEWKLLRKLAGALCWKELKVVNNVAVWRKLPLSKCPAGFHVTPCAADNDADAAWYYKLQKCATPPPSTFQAPLWPARMSAPSPRVQLVRGKKGGIFDWLSAAGSGAAAAADGVAKSATAGGSSGGGSSGAAVGGGKAGGEKEQVEVRVDGDEDGKEAAGGSSSGSKSQRRRLLAADDEKDVVSGGGEEKLEAEGGSEGGGAVGEEAVGGEKGRQLKEVSGAHVVSEKDVEVAHQQRLLALDTKRWVRRVAHYRDLFLEGLSKKMMRNVLDMNAGLGGFAAALVEDPVWVMNVVPTNVPNTLTAIYDRGFIGTFHDWCEAFSTYPRSFDLIHLHSATSLKLEGRCEVVDVVLEMDRVLRPGGMVVVRDLPAMLSKIEQAAHAVHWATKIFDTETKGGKNKILAARKVKWHLEGDKMILRNKKGLEEVMQEAIETGNV